MITAGQTAPDFTLPQDGGDLLMLSALRGQKVVLFFYPKDSTPTCTTEAVDFSARIADFHATGAVVIGVSKDSVASHGKFRAKHGLSVRLASDEAGGVCEAYGVWAEKSMYGKTYMGIERTTLLIDAGGQVAQVWPKVKVKGHVEAVLSAAQAL